MHIIRTIAVAAAVLGGAIAASAAFADNQSSPARIVAPYMAGGGNAAVPVLPAAQLAKARVATAKYATDLGAAKAAGYQILTKLIPGMGYHYLNPKITGFDVRKPPILVYEKTGAGWQLGALEWVFPKKPATAPLKGATYGSFPAACQYADGTFVPNADQATCGTTNSTGAKFTFWHPELVTMHVWIWYPNPAGIYASTNPLVHSFS